MFKGWLEVLGSLVQAINALLQMKKERIFYDLARDIENEMSNYRREINNLRSSDSLEDKHKADYLLSLLEHRITHLSKLKELK